MQKTAPAKWKKRNDQLPATKIGVELVRRPVTRELAIRVSLQSCIRSDVTSIGYVNVDESDCDKKVPILGGSLAEHQNQNMGDMHDPDIVARAVERMYADLKKRGESVNRRIESK